MLVAAFANSPLRDGKPTGWRSARQQVWAQHGSGPHPGACQPADGDPRDAWTAYALDAKLMCVRDPDSADWTAPPGLTFRDWLRGGSAAPPDLRPPTSEDLSYHLSTLFPPVRPQGHMELRMIDAQRGDGWIVPAAVVTALADDPRAVRRRDGRRRAAVGRLGRRARIPGCARPGAGQPTRPSAGPASSALRRPTAALSRSGAPVPIRQAVADFTERYVRHDRCPADDQLEEIT